MRSIAVVSGALACAIGACYSPGYRDCEITCASGSCPAGLACSAGFCREPGMTTSCSTPPQEAGVDGPDIDAAPLGPWGAPVQILAGPNGLDDPAVTGDLLEMFMSHGGVIVVALRSSPQATWGNFIQLGNPVLSGQGEHNVTVSGDGLTLIVSSQRGGGQGALDLWEFRRPTRASSWSTVSAIAGVNSIRSDTGPSLSPDALSLVFDSDRVNGNYDIYFTQRASVTQAWGPPTAFGGINTSNHERGAILSADKLAIYFQALVGGSTDIFTARRASEAQPFGPVTRITEVNSASNDGAPWVSADQRLMYFASDRNGSFAIYESRR
jgi:Tol biopolymer transport system component